MGQANGKMSRAQYHNEVLNLKAQIASKRDEISAEFDELNRRKEQAFERFSGNLQTAGLAAVGLICLGSLTNALFDLVRKDAPEMSPSRQAPPLLISMATSILRWAAMDYISYKLAKLRESRDAADDPQQEAVLMLIEEQQ